MPIKSLLIAVSAICFCGSLGANANIEARSRIGRAGPSTATGTDFPTFNLQDYGAVGDGVTDDGPALQRALDAAADAGGGVVYVPAGRYAIDTPVVKDFSSSPGTQLTIQGVESSTPIIVEGSGEYVTAGLNLTSEFVIGTGETANALSLSGLDALLIKDLVFIGTLDRLTDALVTISLADIAEATIQHCEFYGLASFVEDGAVVLARHSRLNITETAFLGCTANSGLSTSVVENISWQNISVSETVFTDYGQRPELYGKTPWGPPYSWIGIGNAAGVDNLSPRREAFIEHVFLDEGHIFGISSRPDLHSTPEDSPIDLIYISRLRMNVNNLLGSGLYLYKAQRVFVSESYFGWTHNTPAAITIADVGGAVIDRVVCDAAADTIVADSRTKKLTVIDSVYKHLDSAAQTTVVIDTATADDGPAEYVEQQFRDELQYAPDAAAHDYWTTELLLCAGEAQCVAARQEDLASYLAGEPSPTFSITGQITGQDGAGMPGVMVTVSGSQLVSTETDDNGEYVFAGLPTSGRYVVTPTKKHFIFDAASESFDPASDGRTANFTALLNTHAIRGNVTSGGYSMAGVTVALSCSETSTTVSDSDGNYLFTDIDGGSNCSVTASKAHFVVTPQSYAFDDLKSDQTADFGAELLKHTISGRVTSSGYPMAGVTLALSGSETRTTISDSDGKYLFTDINGGCNCTVTAVKANYALMPQSYTFDDLGSDRTADFGGTLLNYTISGSVKTADGFAIAGTKVSLTGSQTGTVLTKDSGDYSFTVPAEGDYTLSSSKVCTEVTPVNRTLIKLSANQTLADFVVGVPLLSTEENTDLAIALDSVTLGPGPFSVVDSLNFSSDQRTRISLFLSNTQPSPCQDASLITVQGEDVNHSVHQFPVEFVGGVPNFNSLTQLIVKLPDTVAAGPVVLTVRMDGIASNQARLMIK